jgi:hypothetical protein
MCAGSDNIMMARRAVRNAGPSAASVARQEKEIRRYIEAKTAAGWTAERVQKGVWLRWGRLSDGHAGDGSGILRIKMSGGWESFKVNPWFSTDARQRTPAHGGIAFHQGRKKQSDSEAPKSLKAVTAGRYKGYTISRTEDGEFFSSLDRDSMYSTKAQVQRAIDSYQKGRGNPAKAAAAGYEEFHGHPSKEVVTVSKKIHHHAHLAAAGELRGLSVRPIGHGLPVRTIGGFKGAILAFNEAKNQLFIEGGDQWLSDAELHAFGVRKIHEIETLGKVVALDYFTSKSHLGSEGGTAVYAHKLRTTNENGRHVTVVIARYPDLIYRVLDQQLEFSGGSYEIRAEGIDK